MRTFRAILAMDDTETAEGMMARVFPAGCFSWRDCPLTMRAVTEDEGGHYGAFPLGRMDEIHMEGNLVVSTGVLFDEGDGEDADRRRDTIMLIENGTLNSISVDPGSIEVSEEMVCVTQDEEGFCEEMSYRIVFTSYQIAAATVVATPALEGTLIELDPVAPPASTPPAPAAQAADAGEFDAAVAAVAAELDTISADWLAEPADLPAIDGPDGRVPHITEDGRVFGYLASWQDCHVAFSDRCQTPWRTATDYAYALHCGPFPCSDGEQRRLAPLAVQGGHYPTSGTNPATGERYAREWQAAQRHYDDPSSCAAYVMVGENEHGIWFSGQLRNGVTDEQVALLRRHQLSGDWRRPDGNMELVGMCSVNFPGFIRRLAVTAALDAEGMPTGEEIVEAAFIGGQHAAVASAGSCCAECAQGRPCATAASLTGNPDKDQAIAQLQRDVAAILRTLEPQRRQQLRDRLLAASA